MRVTLCSERGFTLIEVLFSSIVLAAVLSAMVGTFVLGRFSAAKARHHAQAMNLLREKVEELTSLPYANVVDEGPTAIILDSGLDVGSAVDDIMGTLQVQVEDSLDLDGDADTVEEQIDVNGDGLNDLCKPVTVTMVWQENSLGGAQNVTEILRTFISQ